jgi:ABC-type sugar transport system permease subunit
MRRFAEQVADAAGRERHLGWALVVPALVVIVLVAIIPLGWTLSESLHQHDLRTPWRDRPFIGWANYAEAAHADRFWRALQNTVFFTATSVILEVGLGLAVALALNHVRRARGLTRTALLLPWAIPAAVVALLWRFLFDARAGFVNHVAAALGLADAGLVWFSQPTLAWVPVILADVWKTTPFVALLLLAGLQGIDEGLYESARIDGAGAARRLLSITLPMLKPALLVTLVFRTLDGFRVFDLIYVMTGGGPGTATEPVALYAFNIMLQDLRFGYGAAVSVVIFLVVFLLAVTYIGLLRAGLTEAAE